MSIITIEPATLRDVAWVAAHMRADDRREVVAITGNTDIARDAILASAEAWCAFTTGEPACAYGVARTPMPALYSAWLFATNRASPRLFAMVTRHLRDYLVPAMLERGANRCEARSIDGHHRAHRWLGLLGAKHEAELHDYGLNRETFHLFAWTKTDVQKNKHDKGPKADNQHVGAEPVPDRRFSPSTSSGHCLQSFNS